MYGNVNSGSWDFGGTVYWVADWVAGWAVDWVVGCAVGWPSPPF